MTEMTHPALAPDLAPSPVPEVEARPTPWARDFLRSLRSETLKLRRTPATWVVLIAPTFVATIYFFTLLRAGHRLLRPGSDPWVWITSSSLTLWTTAILPILVFVIASQIADLESRGGLWKHLFALPVARTAVYAAKQVVVVALVALALAVLTVLTFAAGRLLHLLRPDFGFDATFPAVFWLRFGLAQLATAGILLAVHTWLGLLYRSFVPGLGLAVLGMALGALVKMKGVWPYFPWALPLHLLDGLGRTPFDDLVLGTQWLLAGAAGGLAAALLGAWHFTRRDVF